MRVEGHVQRLRGACERDYVEAWGEISGPVWLKPKWGAGWKCEAAGALRPLVEWAILIKRRMYCSIGSKESGSDGRNTDKM